jgi:hypothetical protein
MSTFETPDFKSITAEDALRIARLQLEPDDELRVAGAYEHWLQLLCAEARKQRDTSDSHSRFHPHVIVTSVPGRDVRRNVILDWVDGAEPELFAQIWIDRSGAKVMYRFCGHGYPAGDQGASSLA